MACPAVVWLLFLLPVKARKRISRQGQFEAYVFISDVARFLQANLYHEWSRFFFKNANDHSQAIKAIWKAILERTEATDCCSVLMCVLAYNTNMYIYAVRVCARAHTHTISHTSTHHTNIMAQAGCVRMCTRIEAPFDKSCCLAGYLHRFHIDTRELINNFSDAERPSSGLSPSILAQSKYTTRYETSHFQHTLPFLLNRVSQYISLLTFMYFET